MNQSNSEPALEVMAEAAPKQPLSSLKLMAIITLRILGFRKKQFNEGDFERSEERRVGKEC